MEDSIDWNSWLGNNDCKKIVTCFKTFLITTIAIQIKTTYLLVLHKNEYAEYLNVSGYRSLDSETFYGCYDNYYSRVY